MRDRMISEIVNAISFFIEDPCCLRKAKERIEGIVSKYVVSASEGAIIQYDEAGRNLVASYIVSRKIQGCKKIHIGTILQDSTPFYNPYQQKRTER